MGAHDDTLGVEEVRPPVRALRILGPGLSASVPLDAPADLVIGRGEEAEVRIEHASVSRRHARLRLDAAGAATIEDQDSQNGVCIGGRRLGPGERAPLPPGLLADLGSVSVALQNAALAPRAHGGSVEIASERMRELYALIDRVAPSKISVLLLGETGVGKERMAERVHAGSDRREGAFLRLNCGALGESLLESELFGHEKGAFTGAERDKLGLLEAASGGTVFLDEVGELSPAIQAKLLRALESGEIMRVGGLAPRQLDVRFVAATNRDLASEVERGGFRRDLYYRLAGFTALIPPLRERKSEIRPLAERFLAQASSRHQLSPQALRWLETQEWPGNVRELRHVIERAALLATGPLIEPSQLESGRPPPPGALSSTPLRPEAAPSPVRWDRSGGALKEELDALERERILDALERCAGNQTRAAKRLGISRNTLAARIEAYGLPRPRKP